MSFLVGLVELYKFDQALLSLPLAVFQINRGNVEFMWDLYPHCSENGRSDPALGMFGEFASMSAVSYLQVQIQPAETNIGKVAKN